MTSRPPHRLVPLFSEEAIDSSLDSMAKQIDESIGSEPYIILGLLEGGRPTLSALKAKLTSKPEFREIKVSSYSGTTTTGIVSCDEQWGHIPNGATILVVDDVLDSGKTFHHIRQKLLDCGAAKVLIAVTVDKPEKRKASVSPDFFGFRSDDRFLVGFGMDYDGLYYDLPRIDAVEFE